MLAALWEAAGDIVVVIDAVGRLAAINESGLRLLGQTREQAVGSDWFDLALPPKDNDNARILHRALLDGELSPKDLTQNQTIRTALGWRRLRWGLGLIDGPDGQPAMVLACGRDVDAQSQLEAAVREKEAEYRDILDAANDAIFIQDPATGQILDANERAVSLYGYGVDELRRITPDGLSAGTPPHTGAAALAKLDQARRGQPQLFEWLARDKTGRLFWTEVNLRHAVVRGQDRIIAVVRDITERKNAERALRESEKKFRQLAETIGEVFWLASPDVKRIFYVSPAYETLWGRPPVSLYASPQSWLDSVHPEDRDKVLDHMTRLASGPPARGIFPDFRVVRDDGSVRWVQARYFPVIGDSGGVSRLAGTLEDITDRVQTRLELERVNERLEDMVRKRTQTLNRMNEELIHEVLERREAEASMARAKEAAEAASRAKSAFLANISHEIRTPMNGILGMAQILGQTGLSDDQKEFLKDIEGSASSLLALINDLLDFSRIEAERVELAHEAFGLRAVLASVEAAMGAPAREKGLELSVDISPDVPDMLLGDADRLRQVLTNLVGNAIKFTDHGGVVVQAQCVEACRPAEAITRGMRQELLFSVSDTGIGILPEDTSRIFEAFTQADGSYTRRFGGTGLGLAITRRLVALMGGELGVDSVPDQGSVFTFSLTFELEPLSPRH
ncbi:PAS domain-containing protein [Solidesulfovibrio fructosivorans]|nr:PAS domain S-box protein [Solidesulfovibrio fructosivorans]